MFLLWQDKAQVPTSISYQSLWQHTLLALCSKHSYLYFENDTSLLFSVLIYLPMNSCLETYWSSGLSLAFVGFPLLLINLLCSVVRCAWLKGKWLQFHINERKPKNGNIVRVFILTSYLWIQNLNLFGVRTNFHSWFKFSLEWCIVHLLGVAYWCGGSTYITRIQIIIFIQTHHLLSDTMWLR